MTLFVNFNRLLEVFCSSGVLFLCSCVLAVENRGINDTPGVDGLRTEASSTNVTLTCPCQFKDGQKLVVEFDLMEPNGFNAKNGVIIRAGSVLPLE
jgi:hypothetical protein